LKVEGETFCAWRRENGIVSIVEPVEKPLHI
jgi:hypothetical protein